LRKRCKLQVSENKLVRKIFGTKGNELSGDWNIL
jgi:hypothetical protein